MLPSEWKRKKKEELKKPQVHNKISNTFIENVLHDKTLSAIKICYYLSTILKDFDHSKELNTITINLKDMLKYTELTMGDIRNNLKKLQKTSISFVEKDVFEEHISLIPRFKIHLGRNKKIEIDIYSKIAKQLVNVVSNYTFINTKELMKLKKIHSLRLLPILNMINGYDLKQKTYNLEDLNSIFETNYNRLVDIERFILIKAKEELDDNSMLTFDYEVNFEALGTGRSSAVSITIKPLAKKNYQSTIFSHLEEPEQKEQNEDIEEQIRAEIDLDMFPDEKRDFYIERLLEFIEFCVENNKVYKNWNTSFSRHVNGYIKNLEKNDKRI